MLRLLECCVLPWQSKRARTVFIYAPQPSLRNRFTNIRPYSFPHSSLFFIVPPSIIHLLALFM